MQLRAVILFCKMDEVYQIKAFLDVLNVTLKTNSWLSDGPLFLTIPWNTVDDLIVKWQPVFLIFA